MLPTPTRLEPQPLWTSKCAVARVWGTSKSTKGMQNACLNAQDACLRVFYTHVGFPIFPKLQNGYYNKLETVLPNLTCPEHEPQPHCEHRQTRDSSHSYLELRNVAAAQNLGRFELYVPIKYIQNASFKTQHAFLHVLHQL